MGPDCGEHGLPELSRKRAWNPSSDSVGELKWRGSGGDWMMWGVERIRNLQAAPIEDGARLLS